MNADVGAMIKGLFSKKAPKGEAKAPQNPYTKTLISIVTILILIASYIYFIYFELLPRRFKFPFAIK